MWYLLRDLRSFLSWLSLLLRSASRLGENDKLKVGDEWYLGRLLLFGCGRFNIGNINAYDGRYGMTCVHFPFSVRSLMALSKAEQALGRRRFKLTSSQTSHSLCDHSGVNTKCDICNHSLIQILSTKRRHRHNRIKPVDNFRQVDRICYKSASWLIGTLRRNGKHTTALILLFI
jgi:hypothetical protein